MPVSSVPARERRRYSGISDYASAASGLRLPATGATGDSREALIRRYAAGEVTRRFLPGRGFDDYVQVLGALGELGLRPQLAPMSGPNREARERGRAISREALRSGR